MSGKALVILAALAAVFGILAVVGQRDTGTGPIAGDSAGTLLLPDVASRIDDVTELSVDGSGSERLVTLERAGNEWLVDELGGYPADSRVVNALLVALADAEIVEEKTADPAFHSRLGVEDVSDPDAGGIEIRLSADGGEPDAVVVGDSYSGNQRYARLADSDQSVLVDRLPDVARDPADWVDRSIIDIAGDRIEQVTIRHADGETLVLRKSSPDDTNFAVDDVPEGRELQYDGIANVTGSLLEGLSLESVRPAVDAGDEVAATEFRTFDGLVVTVVATAADDETDPWLAFSVRPAETPPTDADRDADTDPDAATGSEDADDTGGPSNAIAQEAEALNDRLSGWQYRIPSFQYSQLTRRIDDLLRAEDE